PAADSDRDRHRGLRRFNVLEGGARRASIRRAMRMVSVHPERLDDVAAIHAVHAASFPTELEAELVSRLRSVGRLRVSLVAEVGGVAVGPSAFSPVTAASGAAGAGLAPVAVATPHRRQGIAAELVRAGLEACRAAGYGWAVVMGEPAYYSRFGFRPAAE